MSLGEIRRGRLALAAILFALFPLLSRGQSALPTARDFAADGELMAAQRAPMIVLVSLPGCPHCELVRRSYLSPLLRDGMSVIRQIELNGSDSLTDFDGRVTTHAAFARAHKVRFAPVVMFFDAHGAMAAKSLVGTLIPEFYGAYFDEALAAANAATKGPPAATR